MVEAEATAEEKAEEKVGITLRIVRLINRGAEVTATITSKAAVTISTEITEIEIVDSHIEVRIVTLHTCSSSSCESNRSPISSTSGRSIRLITVILTNHSSL